VPGEQNNTPDGSRPRSLDDVMSALKKANPKADPATLARAAALYMPWMTEEDQVLLRQEMMKNTAAISAARFDTQRDIAGGKNETALAIAQFKVKAANDRAEQVNQRALKIAADRLALGQQKVDDLRRSGDQNRALGADKELRLQQAEITRAHASFNNAMYNASLIQDPEAQAAAVKAATDALESSLDALNSLPDPRGEAAPAKPPGNPPLTPQQRLQHPTFDESQKLLNGQQSMLRTPANSQLSLAQINAKRRSFGMKPLASMA
jgi:hypothetical protein